MSSRARRPAQDLHRLRFQDALDDCIALSEAGVPYMIIGAIALAAWGRPRATLDLAFHDSNLHTASRADQKACRFRIQFRQEMGKIQSYDSRVSQTVSIRQDGCRPFTEP